jgi:hypothetical protein
MEIPLSNLLFPNDMIQPTGQSSPDIAKWPSPLPSLPPPPPLTPPMPPLPPPPRLMK